jgi:5'-nucleotidase
LNAYQDPDYCFAAYFASCLLKVLPSIFEEKKFCLNVNIPALPAHQIKGIKLVRQSTSPLVEKFERRVDPHGNIYYWQCSEKFTETDPETDVLALQEGFITLSPLFYDLTFKEIFLHLKDWKIHF